MLTHAKRDPSRLAASKPSARSFRTKCEERKPTVQ
jgi:hypothetical protein